MTNKSRITVEPLHDRVLVMPLTSLQSHLTVPAITKESSLVGAVVAVGDGKVCADGVRHPLVVKQGDNVIYSKYAGSDIGIDGITYLLLREDDILGIVKTA